MGERRVTLTDRIHFAEGWLDRARRQIRDGQVVHGTLTMILAEAELHRAREEGLPLTGVAGMPAASPPRASWIASGVLAAAAAALVAVIVTAPFQAPVTTDDAAPPIVTLAGGTGEMFRIITVPGPVVERTVVHPRIIHVAARPPRPALPAASVSPPPAVHVAPAARPSERPAAQAPPVPPTAPAVAAPAPAVPLLLLSDADVIELVLAAERSLRRSANQ
jgi:hypothetical protein